MIIIRIIIMTKVMMIIRMVILMMSIIMMMIAQPSRPTAAFLAFWPAAPHSRAPSRSKRRAGAPGKRPKTHMGATHVSFPPPSGRRGRALGRS